MERFVATLLKKNAAEEVEPLFDLVIYGATHFQASLDLDHTKAQIEVLLRKRNLQLKDFAGIVLYEPDDVPGSCCVHVYVERRVLTP